MAKDKEYLQGLEEYIRQGEPQKQERGRAWQTAIGQQEVDGLKTSPYLLDTVREHIEGDIAVDYDKHRVEFGEVVEGFDRKVNEVTVTEIAKQKPNFFVMRDASAANDNVLDNFEQIFKHYPPDTINKIL